MKILILASQHGNEYSGEKLYKYIKQRRPGLLRYVDYFLANPRARKQRVRYIESDMNRSYTGKKTTHEERRALKTLKRIDEQEYDIVLDMHTTTTVQPPCIILAKPGQENNAYLQASSIQHIVAMGHTIVDTALNGRRGHALSIEVNQSIDDTLLSDLCDDIDRFIRREVYPSDKYVYEVKDLLGKSEMSEADANKLQNFTLSERGFYPVLVGENSYKEQTDYLGFKAYKRYKLKV